MQKKIDNLCRSLGTVYLGDWLIDIYDDEELKQEIYKQADAEMYLAVRNNRSVDRINNVVIIALILIALEEYDGTFWDYVEDYFHKTFIVDRSIQWTHNKFRELIRYQFGETSDGKRLINHLLVQAFVPKKYLGSFFEFTFAIFQYNYDYYLADINDRESLREVEEELSAIFDYLFSETSIDEKNEKLELNLDNSYKEYQLITSTKLALGDSANSTSIIRIVIDILKLIEARYYNEDLSIYRNNSYFSYGLEQWWQKFDYKNDDKRTRKSIHDKLTLKPKIVRFNYNNNSIILKTRRHNIMNYSINDKVRIEIINNGKLIYTNNKPVLKSVVGGFRLEPIEIEVNSYFGHLEYRLYLNDKCIYTSKEMLNIDVLFFDKLGNPISNYSNYIGNMTILTSRKIQNIDSNYRRLEDGYIYKLYKSSDTILDFGMIQIVSDVEMMNTIVGIIEEGLEAFIDDNPIKVMKELEYIQVDVDTIDVDILHIKINDMNKRIPKEAIQLVHNNEKEFYRVNLDFLKLSSNIYNLKLVEGSKGVIASYDFIIDSELNIEENDSDEGQFTQTLESAFFKKLSASQFLKDLEDEPFNRLTKTFDLGSKKIIYNKKIMANHLVCDKLSYHPNHLIWLGDIENFFEIKFNDVEKLIYYDLDKRPLFNKYIEDTGEGIYVYKQEIEAVLDKTDSTGLLINVVYQNSKHTLEVLRRNYLIRNKNEVHFGEGEYYLDLEFKGKNPLQIEIIDNNIITFKTQVYESGKYNLPIQPDTLIRLQIVEGEDNVFAKTSKRILKSFEFYHHSLGSLLEKKYRFETVYLEDDDTNYSVRNTFIENLAQSNDTIIADMYYVVGGDDKRKFRELNPVNIEFFGEVYDHKTFFTAVVRITDNDQDGLLYNQKYRYISKTGEAVGQDRNSPDIDRILIRVSKDGI